MKKISIFIFLLSSFFSKSQNLYFPPTIGNNWETTAPKYLNWCESEIPKLYNFLEQKNSKAFIVLKDGKIVLEKYFGNFKQDSIWYWASAGKSLTSLIVGIAQQEGKLNLKDKTSKYLGNGWTSLTPAQEDKITIWHQLSMTSGLDDTTGDKDCTTPSCLIYKAEAGTRWAYHNAPYTLLDKVLEGATGQNLNGYISSKLKTQTGITGLFVKSGSNNVFFSTPRSFARFGLLALNKGKWGNNSILSDQNYYAEMINTSQNINKSYGYLWWLNGKENYMLPGIQLEFKGNLTPNGPKDMFSALGKNGQICMVVPSENMVVIRMGNDDGSPVPTVFVNDLWLHLNNVICKKTNTEDTQKQTNKIMVYPNPANDFINFEEDEIGSNLIIFSNDEKVVLHEKNIESAVNVQSLKQGIYIGRLKKGDKVSFFRFIKH